MGTGNNPSVNNIIVARNFQIIKTYFWLLYKRLTIVSLYQNYHQYIIILLKFIIYFFISWLKISVRLDKVELYIGALIQTIELFFKCFNRFSSIGTSIVHRIVAQRATTIWRQIAGVKNVLFGAKSGTLHYCSYNEIHIIMHVYTISLSRNIKIPQYYHRTVQNGHRWYITPQA